MSTSPVVPRRTAAKAGFGGLLGLVFILVIGGFFIYNMFPNLISAIIPGAGGGLNGEWVGLVTYQQSMMRSEGQPAALKITMQPTEIGNVVHMYDMKGELTIAGHTRPITFEATKAIISDMSGKQEIAGFTDSSNDPGFSKGSLDGNVNNGTMHLEMTAMGGGAGGNVSIKGDIKKGTDADYTALIAKIK